MVQLTVMFLQRFGDLQTEVWEDVRDVVEVGWLGVGGVDFEVTRGGSMRGSTVGEVLMRFSRDSCL